MGADYINVNGTRYYFSDVSQYNAVASANTVERQLELIEQYQCAVGGVTISTDENDLVYVDEGNGTAQFNDAGYSNYLIDSGLTDINNLSSESKLKDIEACFNKVSDELDSAMREIDSAISGKDPDKIESAMAKMVYGMNALNSVGSSVGANGLISGSVVGISAAVGIGVPAACIATSTAAIGTAIAGGAGVMAATSAAVPVAGWVVAGICLAVAAGVSIYNKVQENKIDDLIEKMQEKGKEASDKFENAKTQIGNVVNNEVQNAEDAINSIPAFQDIKSIEDIMSGANTIVETQTKLERWSSICTAFDIQGEGTNNLANALELLNADGANYADTYIREFSAYAINSVETSGDIVADTGSYVATAGDLQTLMDELKGSEITKNINTDPLTQAINVLGQSNNQEVQNDAGTLQSSLDAGGSGTDLSAIADTFTTAGENKAGVDEAAADSVYDVDTAVYNDVSAAAVNAAQNQINEYLQSIQTSGKSIQELNELYNEVSQKQAECLEDAQTLGIDVKGFETALAGIKEGEQTLVNQYANEISSKIDSANTPEALAAVHKEANEYIASVSGIDVDTGSVANCASNALNKAQQLVNQKAAEFKASADSITTSAEASSLLQQVNAEISKIQGLDTGETKLDTSALQEVANNLGAKIAELTQKEAEEAKQKEESGNSKNEVASDGCEGGFHTNNLTSITVGDEIYLIPKKPVTPIYDSPEEQVYVLDKSGKTGSLSEYKAGSDTKQTSEEDHSDEIYLTADANGQDTQPYDTISVEEALSPYNDEIEIEIEET